MGITAISQFQNIYAQNVKTLNEYYPLMNEGKFATHVGYHLSEDDQIRRYCIMRTMCDMELDKRDVEQKFDIVFDEYFASSFPKLDEFIADGLVTITDDKIFVNGMGRLVIRNIAMCFDAYLEKMDAKKPTFSRTV
jgi:oxygen-independent coproporphyrinogen-3 oxidase